MTESQVVTSETYVYFFGEGRAVLLECDPTLTLARHPQEVGAVTRGEEHLGSNQGAGADEIVIERHPHIGMTIPVGITMDDCLRWTRHGKRRHQRHEEHQLSHRKPPDPNDERPSVSPDGHQVPRQPNQESGKETVVWNPGSGRCEPHVCEGS